MPWSGFELTTLVVIDTGCTGSCKSNYHTITTTTDAKSKKDRQYNDQIRKDKKTSPFTCYMYYDFLFEHSWWKNLQCGKNIALFCSIFPILSITIYKLSIHIFHFLYQNILHIEYVLCMYMYINMAPTFGN